MNRMLDFVQRNRSIYMVFAGIVVINVAFFIFAGYRETRLYRDGAEVLKETSQKVREARRSYSGIQGIVENVTRVNRRMKSFFGNELTRGDHVLPELTGRLYEILNANRMSFQHVSYDRKPELKGLVNRIVIHVPVKATYGDFRNLIGDLETLPFPVMIDRISISSVSGGEVAATVDIVTFYRE